MARLVRHPMAKVNMEIRIGIASWLPFVLNVFAQLREIGFDVTEEDIYLICQDAFWMELL
jgi:hypothetical protein